VDLIRCIENCSYAEAARHLYRLTDRPRPARSCVTPAQHCSNSIFFPFRRQIPMNPRVAFLQYAKKISISTAINHEAGTTDCSYFLRGTVAVRLYDLCGRPLIAAAISTLTILPVGVNGVSLKAFTKGKFSTMPTGLNLPEPRELLLWSVLGLQ